MKKLLLIFLINSSFLALNAQIAPPDFLCVKGDTLFWDLPANGCGPFISYDIYTSTTIDGPYTLLFSVTDPAQDYYFDPNPAGQLRYYYLLSNYNCPGQAAVPSDTLDSRPPELSPLRRVTVQGGDVVLEWLPGSSPEVYAYIIYRRDPVGVVPIDTVLGNTSSTYTDTNAEPDMESEGYFVNALDRCGNTSLFDNEHKTIFLQATATNCSIDLQWNLYQNWAGGIGSQEVWMGTNGATPTLYETLDGTTDTYCFIEVNDGDTYCFFLQANEAGTGIASRSNQTCLTAVFSQPVNQLYITNVSVRPDNSVEVDWGINANADVELLEYLRSGAAGSFEVIGTEMPASPFPLSNQFLDENAGANVGPVSYQLHAVDSCSNELTTSGATTIFLSGAAAGIGTNQLLWTPLVIDNAVVEGYKIIRIDNGLETEIGTTGSAQLSFEDTFDPAATTSGTLCYVIEAEAVVQLPDGSARSITSRSNVFCIDQTIRLFVPNALAPNGFNREFRPVILSGNIAAYEMQIFDRYGSIVFFSDSPDEAWKGKKEGRKLPQGVYVYRIYLKLENGNEVEKKGHVLLLR